MTVYVDTPSCRPGRLRVSRMAADTTSELLVMVDSMGIRRRRIADSQGVPYFELCKTERLTAIELGAVEVSRAALTQAFRTLSSFPHPLPTP